ncbi:2-aminoethylphosphonate-pyruvate transaminase [Angomonas deanei]|nr:2-aminoethylphosphonate-pyruvate transaminase [Angomonas deanei]|eukprot:EPY41173.1 2-aminoethylphosphonate-pyruvate transaminase [Angomonas deanei]
MSGKRQILFTAGPLQTSDTVKREMLIDYGTRDKIFMDAVKYIREKVIAIAGVNPKEWTCILQPGAGTMGIEACIQTLCPKQGGKYLLINSGKYSERQADIVKQHGIPLVMLKVGEGKEINFDELEELVKSNPDVTTVGYVHHETSTGMVYPAEKIATVVRRHLPNARIIADCISSFGGIPFDVTNSCDIFITSSNKCFHSVPGISIIIGKRDMIMKAKGNATCNTLDLTRQLASFDKSGQFVITAPVQPVMALKQALIEFEAAGGISGREKSYAVKSQIVRKADERNGIYLVSERNRPSSLISSSA